MGPVCHEPEEIWRQGSPIRREQVLFVFFSSAAAAAAAATARVFNTAIFGCISSLV
jgi:hypothetical protein